MSDVTGRLPTALADRYRIERELGAGGMATVTISPDGNWVAYSSNKSGSCEVYVPRRGNAGGQVRVRRQPAASAFAGRPTAPRCTTRPAANPATSSSGVPPSEPLNVFRPAPQLVFRGPYLFSSSVIPSANFDIHPDGPQVLAAQDVSGPTPEPPRVSCWPTGSTSFAAERAPDVRPE